jgi:hypothetical protein
LGVFSVVEELGGVEESFGGHAALEDAEAAEDGSTVHDGDGFAEVGSDAGGVETGGATAENDEVESFHGCEKRGRLSSHSWGKFSLGRTIRRCF